MSMAMLLQTIKKCVPPAASPFSRVLLCLVLSKLCFCFLSLDFFLFFCCFCCCLKVITNTGKCYRSVGGRGGRGEGHLLSVSAREKRVLCWRKIVEIKAEAVWKMHVDIQRLLLASVERSRRFPARHLIIIISAIFSSRDQLEPGPRCRRQRRQQYQQQQQQRQHGGTTTIPTTPTTTEAAAAAAFSTFLPQRPIIKRTQTQLLARYIAYSTFVVGPIYHSVCALWFISMLLQRVAALVLVILSPAAIRYFSACMWVCVCVRVYSKQQQAATSTAISIC